MKLFSQFSRSLGKSLQYAISGIVCSLVNAGVGCLCVFVFHLQEESMFIALAAGYFAQIILLAIWIKIWKYLSFKSINRKCLGQLLAFCWPFALTSILYYFTNNVNKLLIEFQLTSSDVAMYSIAGKFVAVITVLINVLSASWMETIYSIGDQTERKKVIAIWVTRFMILSAFVASCLLPALKVVFPLLIDKQYYSAINLIPALYLICFFLTSNGFLIHSLNSEKKTYLIIISRLASATTNVLITFFLLSKKGVIAACFGSSIGAAVEFIFLYLFNKKVLKIDVSFLPSILFCALYAIATFVFYSFGTRGNVTFSISLISLGFIFNRKNIYTVLKHSRK